MNMLRHTRAPEAPFPPLARPAGDRCCVLAGAPSSLSLSESLSLRVVMAGSAADSLGLPCLHAPPPLPPFSPHPCPPCGRPRFLPKRILHPPGAGVPRMQKLRPPPSASPHLWWMDIDRCVFFLRSVNRGGNIRATQMLSRISKSESLSSHTRLKR